jgi:type I restriction enzyme S subunit
MNEVNKYSHGIVSDRNRLYWDEFKQMPSAFPSTEEQKAIANYLDEHGRHVRRIIRNKQRLIDLLNEQKQAIIHRAVTRGLDPNVRLRPSGIDWLVEVPEHWSVKPLKRWATINARVLPETTDPDYEFRYLDIGTVGTGFLVEQPEQMHFGYAPSRARRILRQGDTIISTVRTYLRAVYFVSDNDGDIIASTGFAVLTPGPHVAPEFLSFVIQSNSFIERVTAHSIGIAYPAIAETRLGAFPLPLPPTQEEQMVLTEYIRTETRATDGAIRQAQREIDLIREYRTRLIADVVTGKLDVRGVVLPEIDETEASENWEERMTDEGASLDADSGDADMVEEGYGE